MRDSNTKIGCAYRTGEYSKGTCSKSDMTDYNEMILLVEDETPIRHFLKRTLSAGGYQCREAANTGEALVELENNDFGLVILDIRMPGKSGIEFLPEIKSGYPDTAVIMATASTDIDTAVQCMKQGAYDYITKPFNNEVLFFSVKRALEKRRLDLEVKEYRQHLEDKVREQAGRIRGSFINTIRALVYALEAKDEYTSGHSQRVADISAAIARELHLPLESIDKVVLAALVHDIGKIGVRESILTKPAKLTDDEFMQVKKHPEIGERIMGPVADDQEILQYIRHHHSYFDGTGYPDALRAYQIPLGARILAVADAFEAMTSERPYRRAMSEEDACAELIRSKDRQFDPEVVEAFFRCKNSL
jgi:putative two-component system response regulator